jgi:hypothetical protein
MADDLTQEEADALLALAKKNADDIEREIPSTGGKITAPLVSIDGRESFLFDVNQSSLVLAKVTYQTRARVTTILARLDLAGAPHRNPDDTEIGVPHLHIYREGYGTKWAIDVPADRFRDIANKQMALEDFLAYCNVVEAPILKRNLFS